MNTDKTEALLLICVYRRSSAAKYLLLIRGQGRIGHFARLLHQLDVETQRLQLANQYVERFRHARLDGSFALDDGLVNLGAAIHIVGLGGEHFLQDVRGAVGFERPDFHFAETLSAELRLAAQRLLPNQRIGRPEPATTG